MHSFFNISKVSYILSFTSISTKKIYSPKTVFAGLDSILVRFISFSLNIPKISYKAPGLCLVEKMKDLVNNNSVIREMFEEGKRLAKIYGKENVYDFSLGNPSVPVPNIINETIKKIVDTEDACKLHGYMSNSGFEDVREKIAKSINKRFDTNFNLNNIVMTVGAASGLNIVLKSILLIYP